MKRPTDKQGLDWLIGKFTSGNFMWEKFSDEYYSELYKAPRQAIDAAMKAEKRGEG